MISRRPDQKQRVLLGLILAGSVFGGLAAQEAPAPAPSAPPYVQQTPDQLEQLVAPIALYPDSLVAQILAASTFPEQVVEADRWAQANQGLQGEALAQAADEQPWDASVKALTAFPAVLGNMDRNLSWTSSLGDAYYNQPDQVMTAIQTMRQRAQAAGTLQSTPQQVVSTQGPDIDIEPANPDVVYVPAYDPWVVYGIPLLPWPDWYPYPGIWYDGPFLAFGLGFSIGFFGGYGWGWHHWGFDWDHHHVVFNHTPYFSHSTTFYNRANFYGHARPGGVFGHPGVEARPFEGSIPAARGYAEPRAEPRVEPRRETGLGSGAFSGYSRGGEARSFSSRGSASFGGLSHGGGARGGGHR